MLLHTALTHCYTSCCLAAGGCVRKRGLQHRWHADAHQVGHAAFGGGKQAELAGSMHGCPMLRAPSCRHAATLLKCKTRTPLRTLSCSCEDAEEAAAQQELLCRVESSTELRKEDSQSEVAAN